MTNTPLNTAAIDEKDIPKEWFDVSTTFGIMMILRCWLPILLLFYACALWQNPFIWITAMFFIGVFQYHINILAHSGQHWQIAKNRALNDFLTLWFLQAPLVLPFKRMRRTHLNHHRDLGGDTDEDREYFDLEMTGRATPATFTLWLLWLFCGGTILGRLFKRLRPVADNQYHPLAPANIGKPAFEPLELFAAGITQIFLALVLWYMTGHVWAYIPLWAMPRFSVMTGLNGIRASIEHADLGKPPHRLKSFSSNLLESFLISPFYMNYHGEHHAYMSVPIQHLPKLRRMFLTSDHARDFEVVPSYWHEYKRLISCMQ